MIDMTEDIKIVENIEPITKNTDIQTFSADEIREALLNDDTTTCEIIDINIKGTFYKMGPMDLSHLNLIFKKISKKSVKKLEEEDEMLSIDDLIKFWHVCLVKYNTNFKMSQEELQAAITIPRFIKISSYINDIIGITGFLGKRKTSKN